MKEEYVMKGDINVDTIRDYGPRLSHVEGQIAGLTVQITGVQNSQIEQGHKLDRIIERMGTKQPTQWGWVASGLLLLGMIIALYTQPLAVSDVRQTQRIDNVASSTLSNTADIARMEERTRWLEKEADRHHQ